MDMQELQDLASETPGLGHNSGLTSEDQLQAYLTEQTEELRNRHDALIEAVGRIPANCDDDEVAGKLGDLAKMIAACTKTFETKRVGEKEPYLTLGRAVDGFFKKYTESLAAGQKKVIAVLSPYLKRKEAEERQRKLDEARRLREEAEAKAREAALLAQAKMTEDATKSINEAALIDEQAAKAAQVAETAKPAEFARTRGGYGSVATLRTQWVGEIIDRTKLDKEKLWAYISDESLQKALNAYVKAGGKELAGASIREETVAQVK